MSLRKQYQKDIDVGRIEADPAQQRVVEELERLHRDLRRPPRGGRFIGHLCRLLQANSDHRQSAITGVYLWGGVGRGKTYLMDLFFDAVPSKRKLRTHFHRFMQRVHQDLTRLQGEKNPLEQVADGVAAEVELLCFDEFFVFDIGDAMILAGLLEALFERGIVLVATSNIHPDGLYENGLQRERFLPAIALLKERTKIVEIASGTDYRLRNLEQATLYHCPIGPETTKTLLRSFRDLAPDSLDLKENTTLSILGRDIPIRYCAGDVAWFDFPALCDGPRSAHDYVEIAQEFHAVILSDVPALGDDRRERARRFINLIDEFYDRRVKLIIAAEVPLDALYRGQDLAFEFERTHSRLIEMQSRDYLGSGHRG